MAGLCRGPGEGYSVTVTNDIRTREAAAMPKQKFVRVEAGNCPHTTIRDDVSMNPGDRAKVRA